MRVTLDPFRPLDFPLWLADTRCLRRRAESLSCSGSRGLSIVTLWDRNNSNTGYSRRKRVADSDQENLHEPVLDRGVVQPSKRLSIHKDNLNDFSPGNEVLVVHCRWVSAQNEKVWTPNVQGRISLAHGWLRFGWLAVASKRNLQRRGAIVNLHGAIPLVVQFIG